MPEEAKTTKRESSKGTADLTPEQIKALSPEQLIEQYDRFLWLIVNRFTRECQRLVYVDREDLYQVATIGLMRAQKLYDPATCTVGFMTHAKQKILREILVALGVKYDSTKEQKYTYQPTLSRLDEPLNAETDLTLVDAIPDDGPSVEEITERDEVSEIVHYAVDRLPPKEKVVIDKLLESKSWDEISNELGITKNCIYMRRFSAFCRLRRIFENKGLKPVHHVGLKEFRRTWTSETEREVLRRESLRRELSNFAVEQAGDAS